MIPSPMFDPLGAIFPGSLWNPPLTADADEHCYPGGESGVLGSLPRSSFDRSTPFANTSKLDVYLLECGLAFALAFECALELARLLRDILIDDCAFFASSFMDFCYKVSIFIESKSKVY